MRTMPDPLEEATAALRTIRGGGANLDAKRAVDLLEGAGCTSVLVAAPEAPGPLELIVGQRPAD